MIATSNRFRTLMPPLTTGLIIAAVLSVSAILTPVMAQGQALVKCECKCNSTVVVPTQQNSAADCTTFCTGKGGFASCDEPIVPAGTSTTPPKNDPATQPKPVAPPAGAVGLPTPLGIGNVQDLIGRVISALMGLMGTVAFLMFLWGGWLWFSARGNDKQITQAKETFFWAGVGLLAIFGAYAVMSAVVNVLGAAGA